MGVIAFTAWGAVKTFLLLFFTGEGRETMQEVSVVKYGITLLISVLSVSVLVTAALNLYVGFSAISEGKGRKRMNIYVAVAVFLTAVRFIGVIGDIFYPQDKAFTVMDKLATIIVDTTSFIMMADLTLSAIRLRRLFPTVSKRRS